MIRALPQQERDLLGRDGPQLQECPEGGRVRFRISLVGGVETRGKVSPTQEFPEESGPESTPQGQIRQAKDPLVPSAEAFPVSLTEEPRRTVHLVPNHENLLVEGEARPTVRVEGGVLGHGSGAPRPIKRKVMSLIRACTPSSRMTMLGFPCEGRMLMREVYSMQPSGPRPG